MSLSIVYIALATGSFSVFFISAPILKAVFYEHFKKNLAIWIKYFLGGVWGYYELNFYEHSCIGFCINITSILDKCLLIQLLGCLLVACLIFFRKLENTFRVVVTFYNPTNNLWVIQFLHIFARNCCCHYCFYFNLSDKCVVILWF